MISVVTTRLCHYNVKAAITDTWIDNSEEGQESEGRIKNCGELFPESRMSPNQGTNNICLDGFQNYQGPKQLCVSYFPSLWVTMSMTLFNACPKLYVGCEESRYLASFVNRSSKWYANGCTWSHSGVRPGRLGGSAYILHKRWIWIIVAKGWITEDFIL